MQEQLADRVAKDEAYIERLVAQLKEAKEQLSKTEEEVMTRHSRPPAATKRYTAARLHGYKGREGERG